MKRISLLVALGALTLAFGGCDNRNGGTDGGGIHLLDGGPDAGMVTRDSGMTEPDSGVTPTGCSVAGATGIPALPAACLPRCSAATASCVQACSDGACQNTCVMNDTTAGTTIDLGGGMTDTLDCNGCWGWQLNSCIYASCSAEFGACIACDDQCDPDTAGCETEEGALNTCITTNMSAIQTCANTRLSMCFGAGGGFLPGLEAPHIQALIERFQGLGSFVPASLY